MILSMKYAVHIALSGALLWACSAPAGEGGGLDGVDSPAGVPSMPALGDPGAAPSGAGPMTSNGAQPGASPTVSAPTLPVDPGDATDAAAEGSRVVRLQRSDFDRVVTDLLHVESHASDYFPEEVPTLHGYFEGAALRVNDRLKTELTLTAEELAQAVRNDAQAYETLTHCGGNFDTSCRDGFITDLVSRAYRRPVTPDEVAAYTNLFDRGTELVQSGDAFADGGSSIFAVAPNSSTSRSSTGSGSCAGGCRA